MIFTPDLLVRDQFKTSIAIPWDRVYAVLETTRLNGRNELVFTEGRFEQASSQPLRIDFLDVSPFAVRDFARHYLAHPEHRTELATTAALDRFRDMERPSPSADRSGTRSLPDGNPPKISEK